MKTKYLLMTLAAAATMAVVGCSTKEELGNDNATIEVSTSYVSISPSGGSATLQLTASGSWSITTELSEYDWLTVSPTSGSAGTTTVTFTAPDETSSTKEAEIVFQIGDEYEYVYVSQLVVTDVEDSSCSDVISGADGKYYRIRAAVTKIANTSYGNLYVNDGTGEVYIYGLLNSYGQYPKDATGGWDSFNIAEGDIITVSGPRKDYSGTIELVDASLLKVEKSYIALDESEITVENSDTTFTINATVLGNGLTFKSDSDWLSVKSVEEQSDSTLITIHVEANPDASGRTGTIEFASSGSTVSYTVNQKGQVKEGYVISDLLNAEDDKNTYYRVQGYVSSVSNLEKGRFNIKDYSGEIYCYNIMKGENDSSTDLSGMISEGDVVTLVVYKTSYKDTKELMGYVESYYHVSEVTIAEFVAAADSKDTWYKITGVVTDDSGNTEYSKKFDIQTYGNFDLVDETGSVYVYGVKNGFNGERKVFGTLGVAEGDTLTIVAYKTTYKGLVEADGCWYVSHTAKE